MNEIELWAKRGRWLLRSAMLAAVLQNSFAKCAHKVECCSTLKALKQQTR